MVKVIACIFIAELALVFPACGGPEGGISLVGEPAAGPVAVKVGDQSIGAAQIERACAESGLGAAEAAQRMIDERLLADEAAGRGLLESDAVVRDFKKALIQELLKKQVEKKVTEDAVTVDEIKTHYVATYANRGLLLEQAWPEIRDKLLKDKRARAYAELVESLEKKYSPVIYYQKLADVK